MCMTYMYAAVYRGCRYENNDIYDFSTKCVHVGITINSAGLGSVALAGNGLLYILTKMILNFRPQILIKWRIMRLSSDVYKQLIINTSMII